MRGWRLVIVSCFAAILAFASSFCAIAAAEQNDFNITSLTLREISQSIEGEIAE